jgi:hypothetical protein
MPQPEVSLAELQRAVDARTLLPGENPNSQYIDDALHWVLVYSELLQFKAVLIDATERASLGLSDAASADIAIDDALLRAQADRYRVRSEFWKERAAVLSDGHAARSVVGDGDPS